MNAKTVDVLAVMDAGIALADAADSLAASSGILCFTETPEQWKAHVQHWRSKTLDALEAFYGDVVESERAHQARAAVAELIEAAKALAAEIGFRIDDPRAEMLDNLRAAIARCGGAA